MYYMDGYLCFIYKKSNKTFSTALVDTIASHIENTMLAEWNHTTAHAS